MIRGYTEIFVNDSKFQIRGYTEISADDSRVYWFFVVDSMGITYWIFVRRFEGYTEIPFVDSEGYTEISEGYTEISEGYYTEIL